MTGPERLDFVLNTLRAHAEDFQRLGVAHMAVFGSVARGEATEESDVDLVVDIASEAHVTLFDLMDIQDIGTTLVGTSVDVITSRGMRPSMAADVNKEAVRVF